MRTQQRTITLLLVLAFASLVFVGCDGNGNGEVVIIDDGGFLYEPAVIQNDSYDDVFIEAGPFGDILLVPGTAVEIDVGPDIYCFNVFINGYFFEEICVASGDVVIFD